MRNSRALWAPVARLTSRGGRCTKCYTVAQWGHFGLHFGTLFLMTFDDSSTKRMKMRSPKGVKSGLLGRVPVGAQAPDLQAPEFVAPLDKSVRVPGCLPIEELSQVVNASNLTGTQAPVRFCRAGPRNRVPVGRVPAQQQAPGTRCLLATGTRQAPGPEGHF